MVISSNPSNKAFGPGPEGPKTRVILIGFDAACAKAILADSDTKPILFDNTDNVRQQFKKIYPCHKDRITLYEGCVESTLYGYLKLRNKEGITPSMHRIKFSSSPNNLLTSFNCV